MAGDDDASRLDVYDAWYLDFNRVYLWALPAVSLVLFGWFWRRRHKFPISRRRPNFLLMFVFGLIAIDESTSAGPVYPTQYGCLLWIVITNTFGNFLLAVMFARAFSLYFLSRLHHERMEYANHLASNIDPNHNALNAPNGSAGGGGGGGGEHHTLPPEMRRQSVTNVLALQNIPMTATATATAPAAAAATAATAATAAAPAVTTVTVAGAGVGIATPPAGNTPVGVTRTLPRPLHRTAAVPISAYYMRHKYLNSNLFLGVAMAALWLVLSIGWLAQLILSPDFHSLNYRWDERNCTVFLGILYQVVVAVALVLGFCWSLRNVTRDTLLFKQELNLNAMLFIQHLIIFLAVAVWGSPTARSAFLHTTCWLGLAFNILLPIWHTYKFDTDTAETQLKYRTKQPVLVSRINRASANSAVTNNTQQQQTSRVGVSGVGLTVPPTPKSVRSKASVNQLVSLGSTDLLSQLLGTPAGFASFRSFLDKEFSTENLLMWNEVKAFRKTYTVTATSEAMTEATAEAMISTAIDLYEKYFSRNAPLEVNVHGWVIRDITAVIERARADIDKAIADCIAHHAAAMVTATAAAAIAAAAVKRQLTTHGSSPAHKHSPGGGAVRTQTGTGHVISMPSAKNLLPPVARVNTLTHNPVFSLSTTAPLTPSITSSAATTAATSSTTTRGSVTTPRSSPLITATGNIPPVNALSGLDSKHSLLSLTTSDSSPLLPQPFAGGSSPVVDPAVPPAAALRPPTLRIETFTAGPTGALSSAGTAPEGSGLHTPTAAESAATLIPLTPSAGGNLRTPRGGAGAWGSPTPRARPQVVSGPVHAEIFRNAQIEVYSLMSNDSFVRYLHSPMFAEYESQFGELIPANANAPAFGAGAGPTASTPHGAAAASAAVRVSIPT